MLVAIRTLAGDKVRQKVALLQRYRSHEKTVVGTMNLSYNAASITKSERARYSHKRVAGNVSGRERKAISSTL